jgi:hypothetical protein
VVDHSTMDPEIEGSDPAAIDNQEKMAKKNANNDYN